MTFSVYERPTLSPVLLAGLALKAMPLSALNALLSKAMNVMITRHRDVFERLNCLDNATFLIDPTDLPFSFLLRPDLESPSLTAVKTVNPDDVTASIHGSFSDLACLLEGSVDGDALVFSRDLIIEGDTEAVLALRNAVDGGNIQIKEDLASTFGPLSIVASKAADGVIALFGRANDDLTLVQDAILKKVKQRTMDHSERLEDMDIKIEEIEKKLRKLKKRA